MARRSERRAAQQQDTAGDSQSPAVVLSPAQRFQTLFTGWTKAYGRFAVQKTDDKGKMQGRPWTEKGEPTLPVYEQHLAGTGPGLGIIMLQEDDSVVFGAIDFDKKNMDHAKACAAITRLQQPLVLCRSKSGGGHFYCFTTEPVPASLMRERLDEWRALLGMAANTEIFPKQSSRFNDDDIGSWINLPYYSATDTTRYAFRDGQPLSLDEFLNYAEARRVTPLELGESRVAQQNTVEALFHEGPPCLQVCAQKGGFGEGERNLGMAAAVVYLKKRHPDNWKDRVDTYNDALAKLGSAELQHIVKTHDKKDYSYQCKQPPIAAHCQRGVCRGRMYGVGESGTEAGALEITELVRYDTAHGDDPLWSMTINGKRILVTNDQFYSRDAFNRAAMAQANVVPVHMPPARWLKRLNTVIQVADIVLMPADASPTGQLWELIVQFCAKKATALTIEEIFLHKAYRTEGKIYFRSQDLFQFLNAKRAKFKSEQHVWQLLRDKGGDKEFMHVKGRGVNIWSLPVPELPPEVQPDLTDVTQDEEF